MKIHQWAFAPLALAIVLVLPASAAAASPPVAPSQPTSQVVYTRLMADGTTNVLESLRWSRSAAAVTASGSFNAGCQFTAYNAFGQVIYSFTIWQYFSYDGTNITYFPAQSTSSSSYWGWALTSSGSSHWWITQPRTAAARGNYTFTQYVAGQPFQSRSGWVQVNINGNGSSSCSSS